MLKTFQTNPGVERFETGGPDGELIVIEAGKPLSTEDPRVISMVEDAGSHALTSSDGAPAAAEKKPVVEGPKGSEL